MIKIKSIMDLLKEKNEKDIKDEIELVDYQLEIFKNNIIIEQNDSTNQNKDKKNFILIELSNKLNILINIKDIYEVEKVSKITKIGFLSEYFLGMCNYDDSVYTVLDVEYLYTGNHVNNLNSRVIFLHLKYNSNIALLCENIKKLESSDNFKLLKSVKNNQNGLGNVWLDKNQNEWIELDIKNFLDYVKVADCFYLGGKKNE